MGLGGVFSSAQSSASASIAPRCNVGGSTADSTGSNAPSDSGSKQASAKAALHSDSVVVNQATSADSADSAVGRDTDSAVAREGDSAVVGREAESPVYGKTDSATHTVINGVISCAAHAAADSDGASEVTLDALTHTNATTAFSSSSATEATSDDNSTTGDGHKEYSATMADTITTSHAAQLSSITSTGPAALSITDVCRTGPEDSPASPTSRSFQPAEIFGGTKHGFVFKLSERGLGYYPDCQHASSAEHAVPAEAARAHAPTKELLPKLSDSSSTGNTVQASSVLEGDEKDKGGMDGAVQSAEPGKAVNTSGPHYWGQALQYLDCSVQVSNTSMYNTPC